MGVITAEPPYHAQVLEYPPQCRHLTHNSLKKFFISDYKLTFPIAIIKLTFHSNPLHNNSNAQAASHNINRWSQWSMIPDEIPPLLLLQSFENVIE